MHELGVVREIDVGYCQQFVAGEVDIRMVVDIVTADVFVAVVDVVLVVVEFVVDFVIAFVVVVAVTWYYLHLLMTFAVVALAANIVASIGCPISVMVDFLFPPRYGLFPISVVCRIYLVNLVVRTKKARIL